MAAVICRVTHCAPNAVAGRTGAQPNVPFNAAPVITPGEAGAVAVAQLQLPTMPPGVGPSPEINEWKMAAVGYPLWLWTDGPATIGPVSDTVAGLTVSLRGKLKSVTYDLGDGASVTCKGAGTPWTRSVEPGRKSPSCGHTYEKPSLPGGSYTVTAQANWAITWTAGGASGTILVTGPTAQVEVPVGELQVLVR